jgi:hypothetical protein
LPKTVPLHRDAWHIDEANTQITLVTSSAQAAARCPACETPAWHVHGGYIRTLAALPCTG